MATGSIVAMMLMATPAQATPIWGSSAMDELTGSRDSTVSPSGGIYGSNVWGNGGYGVSWEISQNDDTGLWTYDYLFTASGKAISHAIIEVTLDEFHVELFDGSSEFDSAGEHSISSAGSSNPLMPNPLFGVKYDVVGGDDANALALTIVTDRAPVYGVFYAKGGKSGGPGGGEWMVAWSTALAYSDYQTNGELTITDFIVRPNGGTQPDDLDDPPTFVANPEPTTAALGVLGVLALAGAGRRRR